MIRVVTDSSADLPAALATALDVTVAPMTIRFGDRTFTDGGDLDRREFWSHGASDGPPETQAPTPGHFIDIFSELDSDETDGIVVVAVSSRLSSAHQSAVLAAEHTPTKAPIRVIDSSSVSMGLGLTVVAAAERAQEGASLEEVAMTALAAAQRVEVRVALDTLASLRRAGRIGALQAGVGEALGLKPLLAVEDGVVAGVGRAWTRAKARDTIIDLARAHSKAGRMAVLHTGGDHVAEVVALVSEAAGDQVLVSEMGPVVATHAGPGATGLAYHRV